jgi:dephospho-CoA kinase
MKKIALTGGIACGKSLTGLYMTEEGFPVCDADPFAHDLMRQGRPVFEAVVREFGRAILGPDGEIDRVRLGRIVFEDPGKRAVLNALVHPAVRQAIQDWLAGLPADCRAAVVIIPLLYEAGLAEGWDAVISVASPRDLQWKRLMERGLTEIEAKQRLAAQLPQAEKMNRADWVIFNSGTKEMLKEQVKAVLRRIVES